MDRSREQYTYQNAGYTSFLNRGLRAVNSPTLRGITASSPRREINFDQMQTSGSLGDKVQVGGIILDGNNRRLVLVDELGVEVGWVGKIE